MDTKAVIVEGITKRFADNTAINQVSFHVNQAEVFGLIGADGAGKTTLLRILSTLLLADGGTARILGYDVVKDFQLIRKSIGYMPGKFSLYPDLSVKENLHFFATLFNTTVQENFEIIQPIYQQLKPFENRKASKLSGGMKQKLMLCCTLIHQPKIIFLDEPTTGVDVVSRKEFWQIISQLKQQNIAIVVSTPYMDEAKLCDRIALMQQGKIMRIDTPLNMSNEFPFALYQIKSTNTFDLVQLLLGNPMVQNAYSFGAYTHVYFTNQTLTITQIEEFVRPYSSTVQVKQISATIEDVFLYLMQQNKKEKRDEHTN